MTKKEGRGGRGLDAGVNDNSRDNRPVRAVVKKAKYGYHGKKDLSKTRQYE